MNYALHYTLYYQYIFKFSSHHLLTDRNYTDKIVLKCVHDNDFYTTDLVGIYKQLFWFIFFKILPASTSSQFLLLLHIPEVSVYLQ